MAQGDAAVLENGARADAELLLAAPAAPTEVLLPPAVVRAHLVHVHVTAMRAARMLAPTVLFHEFDRRRLVSASGWQLPDWQVALRALVLYLCHGEHFT